MNSSQRKRSGDPTPVLVVDDDPGILNVVSAGLRLDGFFPFTCSDGERAWQMYEAVQPQLVIMDVRMPRMDGLTLCRKIREASNVPIIVVTVLNDQKDAAATLEAGADDYVRKPFGVDELRARVKAVLRRGHEQAITMERVAAGPLVVDGARRIATLHGCELMLTPTEFSLLAYLVAHANRVLTHSQILAGVWGDEYTDSPHVLRVTLSRLRQKLEAAGAAVIETLPRVGYRLVASGDAHRTDESAIQASAGTPAIVDHQI